MVFRSINNEDGIQTYISSSYIKSGASDAERWSNAHTENRVFLNHAPYFNFNQLSKKEFTDLVDMMEPKKKIIIEQV